MSTLAHWHPLIKQGCRGRSPLPERKVSSPYSLLSGGCASTMVCGLGGARGVLAVLPSFRAGRRRARRSMSGSQPGSGVSPESSFFACRHRRRAGEGGERGHLTLSHNVTSCQQRCMLQRSILKTGSIVAGKSNDSKGEEDVFPCAKTDQ